jgi:hypothetical protein
MTEKTFTFTHKGKVKKIDLSNLSDDEYNHFMKIKGIANKLNFLSAHNLEQVPELPSVIDLKSQAEQPHKLVSRKQKLVDELKKYKENHPDDVDKPLSEIQDSLLKETSITGEDYNSLKNKTLNEVLNMYIKEVENLNIQNVNNANIAKINKLTTDIDSLSRLINQPFREALIKFTNNIESKPDEKVSTSEINAMKLAAEERFTNLYSLLEKHANESQALKALLDGMKDDLQQLSNNLNKSESEILNKIQTESGKKELEKLIQFDEKLDSIIQSIKSTHADIQQLSGDEKEVLSKLQQMKPTEIKEILQDPEFRKVVDEIINKIENTNQSIQSIIQNLNNNNFGLNQRQQEILDKLNVLSNTNFEELTQKQLQTLNQALMNVNSLSKLSEADIEKLNKLITDATKEAYKIGYDVDSVKTGLIDKLNELTRIIEKSRSQNKSLMYSTGQGNYIPAVDMKGNYKNALDNPIGFYSDLINYMIKNPNVILGYYIKSDNNDMIQPYVNLTNYIQNNKGAISKFINNWVAQGKGISQKEYLDDEIRLIEYKLDFIITLLLNPRIQPSISNSIPKSQSSSVPSISKPSNSKIQENTIPSSVPLNQKPLSSSEPKLNIPVPPPPKLNIPVPPPPPKISSSIPPPPPKLNIPKPQEKSLPSQPPFPSSKLDFNSELLARINNPKLKSVDRNSIPKPEPEPEPKSILGQAVENVLAKRREDISPNDYDEGNDEVNDEEENWAEGVHSQRIFDLKDFLNFLHH